MFDRLSAPFPASKVSWRVGAMNNDKTQGMALAYIDQRDVMDRLDEVCGPGGWQSECYDAGDGRLAAKIGIWIDERWVWKCDGAGAREPSRGLSEMDANKGDFSDAIKRAAVQWGIGRYLYSVPSPWVELDERKRIKENQKRKLENALASFTGNSQTNATATTKSREDKLLEQRAVGKRYDSQADSDRVFQAHKTFLPLANTQAELQQYAKENKREIDALQDAHWVAFMVMFNDRKRILPEGHQVAA